MTVQELDASLLQIGVEVTEILFERLEGDEGSLRARNFDFVAASRLVALGSFGAFVAVVLLVAKSELLGRWDCRALGKV